MLQNVEQETKILETISFEFLIDYLQRKKEYKQTPCISYSHKQPQMILVTQSPVYEGELNPTAIPSIFSAVFTCIREKKPSINLHLVGELWIQYLGHILLFKRDKNNKETVYSISLKNSVPETRLSELIVLKY